MLHQKSGPAFNYKLFDMGYLLQRIMNNEWKAAVGPIVVKMQGFVWRVRVGHGWPAFHYLHYYMMSKVCMQVLYPCSISHSIFSPITLFICFRAGKKRPLIIWNALCSLRGTFSFRNICCRAEFTVRHLVPLNLTAFLKKRNYFMELCENRVQCHLWTEIHGPKVSVCENSLQAPCVLWLNEARCLACSEERLLWRLSQCGCCFVNH